MTASHCVLNFSGVVSTIEPNSIVANAKSSANALQNLQTYWIIISIVLMQIFGFNALVLMHCPYLVEAENRIFSVFHMSKHIKCHRPLHFLALPAVHMINVDCITTTIHAM